MAREGYLILDSDLHMMEPDDLWTRYLDEPFRSSNPPRFLSAQQQQLTPSSEDKGNADRIEGIEVQGLAIPALEAPRGEMSDSGISGAGKGKRIERAQTARPFDGFD